MAVNALVGFATGDHNLLGVGDDDVVAEVFGLVVDGFVLAHEERGDVDGERAENAVLGRDRVPGSREGECCLLWTENEFEDPDGSMSECFDMIRVSVEGPGNVLDRRNGQYDAVCCRA